MGHDLRPSSTRFVPGHGRGEIAQAIWVAAQDAGLQPIHLGPVPTPALAYYAMLNGAACIMVTGSHIPFDRNGYKTYSPKGELRKEDELPINARVAEVRRRVYAQPLAQSKFNKNGMLKAGHIELPHPDTAWKKVYAARYYEFFGGGDKAGPTPDKPERVLHGLRVFLYEHSAVGRDILAEILVHLGAEVIRGGRTDEFVAIDTENFDANLAAAIQALAVEAWQKYGPIDAVVSTDGDSDRPLVVGVEPACGETAPCRTAFFGGDLVGMITAEFLRADAVVVPISCNDAIDLGPLKTAVQPKTRIGSPYVIAGMERARRRGYRAVCGFEANGGFLVGTDIRHGDRVLHALPTRDAVLPIICVLACARQEQRSLSHVFGKLPPRFSRAALLRGFPRDKGWAILKKLSPGRSDIRDVYFDRDGIRCAGFDDQSVIVSNGDERQLAGIRSILGRLFKPEFGFGEITRLNYLDGVRIWFSNGDVAHVRPSGNADELRIYVVADTRERAETITEMAVREPDGLLRQMECLLG
ncbi:MAG: hypothetical protein N3G20_08785 [Verrucomicrobiae bacterium]|nr:hypothetical protein [Verrucomicrobiae bacterium]